MTNREAVLNAVVHRDYTFPGSVFTKQYRDREVAHLLQLDLIRTRKIVMQMVRQGLLEKSGTRKGMVFRLSGNLYHELGDSIAYIREKGIDSLRYEEMVIEYARVYGRITNREVRELLGVDTFRASRLLRELTDKQKLKRMGDKRGAFYSSVS